MDNWILNSNQNDIVISTKIQLSRNIEKVPFPEKLTVTDGRKNAENIYNFIKNDFQNDEYKLYEIWNSDKSVFNEYIDRHLISEKLLKNSDKASFILNKDETVSIMINEEDHIKIQCITAGLNLEEALENIISIDEKIEENIKYAFDEEFGYLTSNIQNIGAAMKVNILIHLPAITMSEEIENISKKLNNKGLEIKGLYLENYNVLGNIYVLSNKSSLGITEEDIISTMKEEVLKIIAEEYKFREILIGKCKYELEDKIYRALAILQHAVLLDFKEALDLISKVRLGIELSIISIDKEKLNKLIVNINNSSIEGMFGRKLSEKEMKYERANIVRKFLI
ncbi:ATP--guanido phosphotransferase [uncultured Clostridium sp.]|uniref:ATP--guanido phosphotransferase n=1 Tax=uncultured Clostridium sp. TaxID=59620 RepID=UPI0025FCA10D|nr:ATP--guanido phosphotransferase [uncultured Clostridium sp.]